MSCKLDLACLAVLSSGMRVLVHLFYQILALRNLPEKMNENVGQSMPSSTKRMHGTSIYATWHRRCHGHICIVQLQKHGHI